MSQYTTAYVSPVVGQPGLTDVLKDLLGLYCSTEWPRRKKPMVLAAFKSEAAVSIANRAIGIREARQLNQECLHATYKRQYNQWIALATA